jgi:hypothetical protein
VFSLGSVLFECVFQCFRESDKLIRSESFQEKGRSELTFPRDTGQYSLSLVVRAEFDGQSLFDVYVDNELLRSVRAPHDDNESFTPLEIADDVRLTKNSSVLRVDSLSAMPGARGRWTSLLLGPPVERGRAAGLPENIPDGAVVLEAPTFAIVENALLDPSNDRQLRVRENTTAGIAERRFRLETGSYMVWLWHPVEPDGDPMFRVSFSGKLLGSFAAKRTPMQGVTNATLVSESAMLLTDGIVRVESIFNGGAPGRWVAVVVKRLDGATTTTPTVVTPSTNSTVTASATTAVTPPALSTTSTPSSSAVAIGAGVGGALFALLVVAVAFLVWRARKSRPQQPEPKPSVSVDALNYDKIPQMSAVGYAELSLPASDYSNIPSVPDASAYTNVPNMAGRKPAEYAVGNL